MLNTGRRMAANLSAFTAGAFFVIVFFLAGATCNRNTNSTARTDAQARDAARARDATKGPSFSFAAPAWAQQLDGSTEETSIADVAERVTPSVVNISATKVTRVPRRMPGPYADPFFRHFFGGPRFPFGDMPRERRQRGLGSGVIVEANGIILTNHHVIEGADALRVELADGRTFNATVIGSDEQSDLAVIRIEADRLPTITIGDSSQLRVGNVVLAVGNPFGVGQTVTMGIVSAVGRANVGITDYEDFIQTDAAINPGNSGGALVNMRGELVGINTAIISRSGGYNGIGFAIPSNMARSIAESLRRHGRVVRGYLGVMIQDVEPALARGLGLPETTRGALVSEVTRDSAAARAGVRAGDVIVEINGESIESSRELRTVVASLGSDTEARLVVLRSGERTELTARLSEAPALAGSDGAVQVEGGSPLAGVAVAPIDPDARRRHGIPDGEAGVVVSSIAPRSPAARSGLREGDVILQVNRRPVRTPQEFQASATAATGELLLLVNRNGRALYLAWR